MTQIADLTNKVFMLSPETKQKLEEAYPSMDENTKKEFFAYIEGIIKKQDEILTYIIKNNPDFLSELRAFNASTDRKNIKEIESTFREQDEIDLLALEKELSKL